MALPQIAAAGDRKASDGACSNPRPDERSAPAIDDGRPFSGAMLLLVSQQPGQTETLAEISDPAEVDRLAGICESRSAHSATQSFSNVLLQVARVTK